jgi:DnaK suppressor protein
VKAQTGKVKVVSKTAKGAAKPVAKSKSAVKTPVKPKPKTVAKAKPFVKTASKTASKPAGKPAAKKAVPAKAPVKKAVAGKERKPAVKVAAKTAKPIKASPVKVAKAAKPAVKVKSKDSVKAMIEKIPAAAAVVPKAKPAPAPVVSASVPARAGRPSSRLAQLTVPSMAQSVASTAAKASFTQTVSSPLIVPPLASAIKKDPKLANNWKTKPVEQLTDAEVIAMHDDDYMNETQLAFFRRKLIQLKKDILSNAGETTEHLREDTVVVPDPADRATIEEEHALELRTRDRERKLLKKIEQSIARIDSGDYGYCDETGEPIGVGRLLARPTANLSLEAQQRRELKQKMFGD